MPGLGDEFRAAREARHLSLQDVSDQLHIRTAYLKSIEDEDSTFAAPVYVRGFIRTYARFLGLEPEAAVASYHASLGEAGYKPHEPVAVAPMRLAAGGPSPWLWIAGIVAAILVGFVSFRYFELQRSAKGANATVVGIASPAPTSTSAAAAPARPAPTAKPAVTQTLLVRVTQDSWISIRIDGASQIEGLVKAGTAKTFHGKNADVRAGNAGGVELTVNGKELGKMGNAGDVVERKLTLAER